MADTAPAPGFDSEAFLATLTTRPGVYTMRDADANILYIGKAKNLKNRLSSHFKAQSASPKQQVMVAKVASVEVTVTRSEGEALLLECQQIKRHQPRYNICLRDGKSFPYIYLADGHEFPRLAFYRGAKNRPGRFFGPYPSASAARDCLKLLQKLFPVRQCTDSFYNNRSRPCLQHQIKRCTAPCVGLVSAAEYGQDVDNSVLFLEGKGESLLGRLIGKMEEASARLEFERAAHYRDQIAKLRTVLEKRCLPGETGDLDFIACAHKQGLACVQVFFIRGGQHLGNQAHHLALPGDQPPAEVLQAFIAQYYLDKPVPHTLVVSHELPEADLLAEVLSAQAKHAVAIARRVSGGRQQWLQLAAANAEQALAARLADKQGMADRLASLQRALGLEEPPGRLECFDISHTQGQQTVASCVVFDRDGPVKSAYRRFNIEGVAAGDDYAAIRQAVGRRFRRLRQGGQPPPDIVLIDGGKGQVQAAAAALAELMINNAMIIGVAKGPDRKPGMERLILSGPGQKAIDLPPGAPGLLLIQHIRDEAHRFALSGHRLRRAKAKRQSALEGISGLGCKRRQLLLRQFGGLQGIAAAGVDALASVSGVGRQLAQRIYEHFHP